MNNPVVGWQIVSPEPDETATFLGKLFGWRTIRDNPLAYREVRAGEGGMHGGVWPAPRDARPFVQLFVEVADIDACVEQAVALGAQVVVPKSALPEGGAMAVFLDPQGLPIAVRTNPG